MTQDFIKKVADENSIPAGVVRVLYEKAKKQASYEMNNTNNGSSKWTQRVFALTKQFAAETKNSEAVPESLNESQ